MHFVNDRLSRKKKNIDKMLNEELIKEIEKQKAMVRSKIDW